MALKDDRPAYICDRCEGHNEPYMLVQSVWEQAGFGKRDRVCVACVEEKLGRQLTLEDYNHSPLNLPIFYGALSVDPSNEELKETIAKVKIYARKAYDKHRAMIKNRALRWDNLPCVIPFPPVNKSPDGLSN